MVATMGEMIKVGMADLNICTAPDALTTLGLGSCVGVALYDAQMRIAGLVHIMLPDSTKITHNQNRMKFADTCLLDMYHELLARGGLKENLRAKIAGGARMFAHHSDNELLNVGHHNNQAVRKFLQEKNIPIVADDSGKDFSRTIVFDPECELLHISVAGVNEYVI